MRFKRLGKTLRIVVFASLAVFTILVIIVLCINLRYSPQHPAKYLSTPGYAKVLGIDSFHYEALIQEFGKPSHITYPINPFNPNEYYILHQYDTIDALYNIQEYPSGIKATQLILVTIKSDAYRFGKQNIGIGSTRAEVEKAYAKDDALKPEQLTESQKLSPYASSGYYGDNWSRILFCYDENDKVESIALEASAF